MMHWETRTGGHEGINLNGMIFLSLLAHLLVLSMSAIIFSRSLPAPKWTFGPIYSVQLVSLPADLPERKEADISYREIMENKTSGQAVLKKESIDTLPSVPVAAVKVMNKPAAGLDHVLEAIRKNIQPAANPPVSDPVSKEAGRMTPHAALPQAKLTDGELNAKMKTYYGQIWLRIKGLWTLPQGILPQGNIEAVIHAQILRDGTVINVGFEKRSGNRYFDESALRAVKKAVPLPSLPEVIRDDSIEVGIRFHSSEFR
jgi:colicin import membrane protein